MLNYASISANAPIQEIVVSAASVFPVEQQLISAAMTESFKTEVGCREVVGENKKTK